MYKISKRIEIAGSHSLSLDYDSPCSKIHGHNWIITVEIEGILLDEHGMLMDFKHIKNVVNKLDHANINEVIAPINPTAENIAKWIVDKIQYELKIYYTVERDRTNYPWVSKVSVQESEGNIACYTP